MFCYPVLKYVCCVLYVQCPQDASKSRRAAENDLSENTFNQVNQRMHTDMLPMQKTCGHTHSQYSNVYTQSLRM